MKLHRQIQQTFVLLHHLEGNIAQKMKFFIKDFFSKCDRHIYWRNP